jgi:aspartate/methionine/tyrosine aminotransferase
MPVSGLSVVAMQQLEEIAERAKRCWIAIVRTTERVSRYARRSGSVRPEFGTVMFPRVRSGNRINFAALLREKYETSVVPGSFFEMPAHFRVGIAGDTDMLKRDSGLEKARN